ncbi:MAG: hypothetical protein LUC98_11410 [Lachnospiraceae bacterium]|nr:hypothetical protein [Lachnospiraceae bacterium]
MPLEISDVVRDEYRRYMKPNTALHMILALLGVVFWAAFIVIGILGIVLWGYVLGGAILAAVGIGIEYVMVTEVMVKGCIAERKSFRLSMENPQMPIYALDFSRGESFYKDDFRMGDNCLYIRHGAFPVEYKDIDIVYVRVTTKIPEFRILRITLKEGCGNRDLSHLPKRALKPGAEHDILEETVKKLQKHNPAIKYMQQRNFDIQVQRVAENKKGAQDKKRDREKEMYKEQARKVWEESQHKIRENPALKQSNHSGRDNYVPVKGTGAMHKGKWSDPGEGEFFRGYRIWLYESEGNYTAAMLVEDLLEAGFTIDRIDYVDDGDVGMKYGGSCLAEWFLELYPGLGKDGWGGMHYTISCKYKEIFCKFGTADDGCGAPCNRITFSGKDTEQLKSLAGQLKSLLQK